jgi:hypothetical protein
MVKITFDSEAFDTRTRLVQALRDFTVRLKTSISQGDVNIVSFDGEVLTYTHFGGAMLGETNTLSIEDVEEIYVY